MEIILGTVLFLLGTGTGLMIMLWLKNHRKYNSDDSNVCPYCMGPSDVKYVNNLPVSDDDDEKELCIECMRPY